MLTSNYLIESSDYSHRELFTQKWYDFICKNENVLITNTIFNFSKSNTVSTISNRNIDETDYLKILNSIENDIYHAKQNQMTFENIEIIYENFHQLMSSSLNVTVVLVQFSYFITRGRFDESDKINLQLVKSFFMDNKQLLNNDELEYYQLFDGISYYNLNSEKLNISILSNLVQSTKNEYIASYALYGLQNAYFATGRYFEILLIYKRGKELLFNMGCNRRLLYYENCYANANMLLGNAEESLNTQINNVQLCLQMNQKDIFNFQLKQLLWTYIRTNTYNQIPELLQSLEPDSPLYNDKVFLHHLITFYLEVGNIEKSNELMKRVEIVPYAYEIYNYIDLYLKSRLMNEDLEKSLKYIIDAGEKKYASEIILYYTPKLIEVLQQKRKYSEIVEYQKKIINNKIQML